MAVRKIPTDIIGLTTADGSWGSPGSYYAVNARNIKFEPKLSMHAPEYQKLEACRGPDESIPGAYGGTLTFETLMRGVEDAASGWSVLCKHSGTFHERAGGSGVVVAASSTKIEATTANIGNYVVGDAIMVTGTSTDTQIRFITRVEDDKDINGAADPGQTTVTVSPAFADTPSASDSLVDIDTWTPAVGEFGGGTYHNFKLYMGQGSTDRLLYTITDCALVSLKLNTTTADGLPVLEWTYECDAWADSEASTTQSADTLQPAHPLLGDPFYVDGTAVAIESIGFDFGLKVQPYTATAGTNGRSGWARVGNEPKLEIKPYHDTSWITKQEAATTFEGMFESIKDADEGWAIWCPKLQVVSHSPEAMANELLGNGLELLCVDPGANADSTNYPLVAVACVGDGP